MLWELKRTVSLYETVLFSIQNICQLYAQQVSLLRLKVGKPNHAEQKKNTAELSRRFVLLFIFSLFWPNRLQQVVCCSLIVQRCPTKDEVPFHICIFMT